MNTAAENKPEETFAEWMARQPGPYDGPVVPLPGWKKRDFKGKCPGWRQWIRDEYFINIEKGADKCFFGRLGNIAKSVKSSPRQLMNWIDHCIEQGIEP